MNKDRERNDRGEDNNDRPRYNDRYRDDKSSGNDRPRYNDRSNNDRPRYNDRSSNDRPRYNDRSSNDRPRYNDRSSNDRPRYNDRSNNNRRSEHEDSPVYSEKLRAGKKRTYFFDVRTNRNNDFYLTITESKKRFDDSYERHKMYVYKEDLNKFLASLQKTIDHIKSELLPDYDFDQFNHEDGYENEQDDSVHNQDDENQSNKNTDDLTWE